VTLGLPTERTQFSRNAGATLYLLFGTAAGNPIQRVVPRPSDSPGRLKWHAISVGCQGNTIDALVLPLGILEYRLVLNATPLVIPATFYSLHTFDFQTHEAKHHGENPR
jgi:hypothetical protein